MAVGLITKTAYARLRGCDEKAVRKAVAEGRISLIDGKIDPVVADIQWARNTRARASSTGPSAPLDQLPIDDGVAAATPDAIAPGQSAGKPAPAEAGYMQFRSRREEADAQIAEMNAAKMRGAMLNRQDVDRDMFEIGREMRDLLIACSRRIAAEVASLSSAEACETVVDREHRIVLEQLVAAFREKIGAAAKDGA